MIHAEYRYHLEAEPERAFAYLSNPAHDADWQQGCRQAALREATPGVGALYDIEFSFMGRRAPFVGRITESTAPSEYAFESVEGPFGYRGRYSFSAAADGGVDVHWQFWVDPGRFFGIVPVSLLRKALLSQVEKDVELLRQRLAAVPAETRP